MYLLPDDHHPFLFAIAANPEDDLPRLIYADYLEETGDPTHVARAHFIRAQIELEHLPARSKDRRPILELLDRINDMFGEQWIFDLPTFLRGEDQVTFRRGFVYSVKLDLWELSNVGERLLQHFPIQGLEMLPYGIGDRIDVQALHFLGRLHELTFGPRFWPIIREELFSDEIGTFPNFLRDLMTNGILPELRVLNLAGTMIRDSWLVEFLSLLPQANFYGSLKVLNLSDCHQLSNASANTLATTPALEQVEELRLLHVQLTPTSRAMLQRRFGKRVKLGRDITATED